MIIITEKRTEKVPGITSVFVSFKYNQDIVNEIKSLPCYNFSKKDSLWEIPVIYLSELIDKLCVYDDIELNLCKISFEEDIIYKLSNYRTQPFDYQIEGIQFGLNHDKWLLLDPPGLGKAVSMETLIYTESGPKPMQEIKVGDMLFDKDGKPTKVLATYEHDDLNMYRMTFTDDTYVDCCEDHQWLLRDGRVVSTKWFLSSYTNTTKNRIEGNIGINLTIPTCMPVEFKPTQQPLDPYIIGCLLGDGSITHNISFTSEDEYIINQIEINLPDSLRIEQIPNNKIGYRILCSDGYSRNFAVKTLKELGLFGRNSHNKFIPDIYKYGSIEQRIRLIQGLMDTDGYAAKSNLLQFTSVSERLILDVREVLESLGAICNLRSGPCGYNSKVTGIAHTLTIRHSDPSIFCSLPRKKNLLHKRAKNASPRKKIKSLVPIDTRKGKCITVDSPSSTYLCKNFIVTHNTLQLIYIAEELKKRDELKHCLIICGINTLKSNWQKEIKRHSKLDCKILGERTRKNGKTYFGSVEDRLDDLKGNLKEFFLITNIETLRNDKIVKAINDPKNGIDCIFFDEIHVCKSASSQQGKNLLKLNKSEYRVGATGTLLLNNPLDSFVPLKWIDADRSTASNFEHYYTVYGGDFNHEFLGYRNLQTLQKQLELYSLRRPKSLLDLPEKTIIEEQVDMSESQRLFYNNVENGVIEEVDKVKLKPNVIMGMIMRLRQATACPSILTSRSVPSAKIERACDLVEQITSEGNKVVIFSTFKQTVEALQKELIDFNPLIGTGDIDDEEISASVDQFQSNKDNKVFIGTWQKCGTGLTLTAASYMIFIDTPWTDAAFTQACDRIYRIGTKKPVTIYNLITTDSVDEKVLEIVSDKAAISDYVLDGTITQKGLTSLQKYIEELRQ